MSIDQSTELTSELIPVCPLLYIPLKFSLYEETIEESERTFSMVGPVEPLHPFIKVEKLQSNVE